MTDATSSLTPSECDALFDAGFAGAGHVVLAVSGGADSVAMLVLAAEWRERREGGPKLSVATVAHGLRAEAVDEAAAVTRLCAERGLPHARLAGAILPGPGVEARAREARYAALLAHAREVRADAIATAHTRDDQAETVLMRLAAGSGPAGLAAMRPRADRGGIAHLRPLLYAPKARLVASLQERGIGWAEDAMNADPAYLRARLRGARDVLEREGLTSARLGALAARMARVEDALEAAVDAAAAEHFVREGDGARLGPGWARLADEIRLRLLARAIAAAGDGLIRLDRLERLFTRITVESAGAATLAGAKVVWADGGVRTSPAPLRRG
ncbi:tRNA lysidine(34) synthetase TilS [Methylopila turkensis]|uniref:tRNA(Ile)-lysidine synthase n=1 Tax=Methylopila turkensis TaxID=1437816 RepID=A0A9W6N5T5_9HYPH|nr:tRNA lysidine(34) synthetase TilS [Methylopila turkensis]GLK78775.1 tRNA(Ile)-lysidine synthase [Methylopila turkensis]